MKVVISAFNQDKALVESRDLLFHYTISNFAKVCLKLYYLLYNSTILDSTEAVQDQVWTPPSLLLTMTWGRLISLDTLKELFRYLKQINIILNNLVLSVVKYLNYFAGLMSKRLLRCTLPGHHCAPHLRTSCCPRSTCR